MKAGGQERGAFVEAHYYSGGLRHWHVGAEASRPEWAPPADDVGFRDEFSLREADVVIEFQRRLYQARRVTWLGLYKRGVDERLGDRENHAGLGVWLLEDSVTSARDILSSLKLLLEEFSGAFENPEFQAGARKFLSGFLPHYTKPTEAFAPAFGGASFAPGALAETTFFQVVGPVGQQALQAAADQIALLSFSPKMGAVVRAVIVLTTEQKSARNGAAMAGVAEDPLGQLVDQIPEAMQEQTRELTRISNERDQIAIKLRDEMTGAQRLREEREVLRSEIEALTKRAQEQPPADPRRTEFGQRSGDLGIVQSRLNDIDHKLSRLLADAQRTVPEQGDYSGSSSSITWENVLVLVLGVLVLGLLGFGAYAGYERFFSRG